MICPRCGADNSDTSRFCSACAASLASPPDDRPAFTETIMDRPQKLARGTLFAGRYEIIDELGRGGMGTVYRAEDRKAKEEIALKLIMPEIASDARTVERFRKELTTARKIRHKNICGMYDLGEAQGTVFITMEYIPGEDLRKFLKRSKQLAVGTAVSIAKQICQGLAEAHSHGVVHRDLKPGNIIIDDDGLVRIMDFGIARSVRSKGITASGMMIGTPEYMSPEQAEAKEVDPRSDIYSLGVILYEMLAGKVPFEGDTPLGVAMKHKSEAPIDPRVFNAQVPEDLTGLVLKCLEKDRDKRYQTAEEVLSALETIEKGVAPTAEQAPGGAPRTSKEITVTIGLKRLWIPALAVVGLALITATVLLLLPGRKGPSPGGFKASLAVLPFEDLSPAKDQAFLCDGISESLINALTMIRDLKIPARTSSFSFRSGDRDIQEIGRRLSVENVLEGSVQRAGDELRVTVKLINVSDESVQWSAQYNKTLEDVFAIQDEITLHVVDELRVKLSGGELDRLTRRETTNPEAYQLYLRGRHFRWIENRENILKAKDSFEQAIEKDPDYAIAHAGLADTYMLLGLFSMMPRDEAAGKASDAAKKALELDENSTEAHTSMGVILEVYDWDWPAAEREFKRAIALNPNHFDAHYEYGFFLCRMKRLNEAESELAKSLEIDPLSYRAHHVLSLIYRFKGDFKKAETHQKTSEDLNTQIISGTSDVETTLKNIEREGRLPGYLRQLAFSHFQSGAETEARKLLDEMKRGYEESDRGNFALNIATLFFDLGQKPEALWWLERSFEKRDPGLVSINVYWPFKTVHQDPRFKAIVKKMGLE